MTKVGTLYSNVKMPSVSPLVYTVLKTSYYRLSAYLTDSLLVETSHPPPLESRHSADPAGCSRDGDPSYM